MIASVTIYLWAGTRLRCPNCMKVTDVLDYMPLRLARSNEGRGCHPILKCRHCRWVFAPREEPIVVSLGEPPNDDETG